MRMLSEIQQFFVGIRKDASSKPPILLRWRSSQTFIFLTVGLAIFTDIFYYGLIVPVIPFSLTVQCGIPESEVQRWTSVLLACYSAALFVGSPIAGMYADHTSSRRLPLLLGLVALAGSTLLLCFGHAIWLLVVGRLLQGLAAAVVWSVGCALLADTADSARVGVAMGWVGIAMSAGLIVAPVLGGVIYAERGYYAVYYLALGVVAVDILMRLVMIEKKVAKQWITQTDLEDSDNGREIEYASTPAGYPSSPGMIGTSGVRGVPSLDIQLASIQNVDEQTTRYNGSGSNLERAALAEAGRPVTPRKRPIFLLLKSYRLLAALYGIMTEAGVMMGFDATLALFVQSTFHWNSLAAGLLFLACFVPGILSPVVGIFSDRYGAKWPSTVGFLACVPLLTCLRFVEENTIGQKVLLGFLLALLGFALTFANTPLMAEMTYIQQDIEESQPGAFGEKGAYGIGYGLFTMAFALGGAVGPLWAGLLLERSGWATMTWTLALWCASAAIVVVFGIGKPKTPEAGETNMNGSIGSQR